MRKARKTAERGRRSFRSKEQLGIIGMHRKHKPVHAQVEHIMFKAKRINDAAPIKVSRIA